MSKYYNLLDFYMAITTNINEEPNEMYIERKKVEMKRTQRKEGGTVMGVFRPPLLILGVLGYPFEKFGYKFCNFLFVPFIVK